MAQAAAGCVTVDFERALAAVRQHLASFEPGQSVTLSAVQSAIDRAPWLLGAAQSQELAQQVHDFLVGAGPLEPLLRDPEVSDVLVNGPNDVWLDRGEGLVHAKVQFNSAGQVRACAQRLASLAGRPLDDAHPWVDAALPDGRRLHAVIPPIAVGSTAVSIRAMSKAALTLTDLHRQGTLTEQAYNIIHGLLVSRRALLITGGTGSGKTTFLNCLLGICDPQDRVVIVEDTTELSASVPNAVRMQTRPPGRGGAGGVSLTDLVRQALRMRPDRVVVGEVRGCEIVDLLMAMNTGHTGGMATIHANQVSDVPNRIHLLGAASGLSAQTLDAALVSGIQAIVHLTRGADGSRQVREIGVLELRDGQAVVSAGWQRDGDVDPAALSRLQALMAADVRANELRSTSWIRE